MTITTRGLVNYPIRYTLQRLLYEHYCTAWLQYRRPRIHMSTYCESAVWRREPLRSTVLFWWPAIAFCGHIAGGHGYIWRGGGWDDVGVCVCERARERVGGCRGEGVCACVCVALLLVIYLI